MFNIFGMLHQVAHNCLFLTEFVVLEMPKDDNMSIVLGRSFLNNSGVVINCNQGKVTSNINDKEHTIYFPKKIDKIYVLNSFENIESIKVGEIYCPNPQESFETIMTGTIATKI